MQEIREKLCQTKEKQYNHRVALFGTGGVGKTQIAVEYIRRHETEYQSVFWMHASDRTALLHHFQLIAETTGCIGSIAGLKSEEVAAMVLSWLRQQRKWILIFDNLDDITVVEGLLPETTWDGHTIITTRNPNVEGIPAEGLEVPVYEVSEAVELLITRSKIRTVGERERAEATTIVKELGYLALAIEQAAAYIREEIKDLFKFLSIYQTNRRRIHNRTPTGNWPYKKSVATVWAMSFQNIRKKNSNAARLLQLFAFLNPDGIIINFLVAGKDGLDNELRSVIEDPYTLESSIFLLEQFSLVSRLEGGGKIAIHRVLQYAIREEMTSRQCQEFIHASLKLSEFAFPESGSWNSLDPQILHICRSFEEQVIAPLTLDEWTKDLTWGVIAQRLASFLLDDGKFGLAIELFSGVMEMKMRLLGNKHLETLTSMNDLAKAYREQDPEYYEITQLQETALTALKEVLGTRHEYTILSTAELGFTYCGINKIGDAVRLCEQAAEIAMEVLGKDHITTLRIQHYLAIAYWRHYRLDDACRVAEKVYSSRSSLLGDKHHDTLDARHNLAIYYTTKDRVDEAIKLNEKNFEIKKVIYGQEHLFTLDTMTNLANNYSANGRTKEACDLYEKGLNIYQKLLGELHPETFVAECGLAVTYERLGKFDEAAALLEYSLKRKRTNFGEEHLDIPQIQIRLALIYQRQCRVIEAIELIKCTAITVQGHCEQEKKTVLEYGNDTGSLIGNDDEKTMSLAVRIISVLIGRYKSEGKTWEVYKLNCLIKNTIKTVM